MQVLTDLLTRERLFLKKVQYLRDHITFEGAPLTITYAHISCGKLNLYTTADDLQEARRFLTFLRKQGIEYTSADHTPLTTTNGGLCWSLTYKMEEKGYPLHIDLYVTISGTNCKWENTSEVRKITQQKRVLVCGGKVVREEFTTLDDDKEPTP